MKKPKTNKQNTFLWMGLCLGIVGGVVGNMLITSMYRILDLSNSASNPWVEFIASSVILALIVTICFFMIRDKKHTKMIW